MIYETDSYLIYHKNFRKPPDELRCRWGTPLAYSW